jgi:2-polyprenyl-6-methoxyphenol hydroxylase-like FAD-dependent oxidoreductase
VPTLINRAVVVGAGMGGLFAAAALASHAEEVLIVDGDVLPEAAVPRDGTPQSRHPHLLLFGGLDAMCEWFPGLVEDVVAAGGVATVVGRDVVTYRPEGKSYAIDGYQPEPCDLGTMYLQTRPVLEACVRNRVLSLPNVHLQSRTRVTGLIHGDERVSAVRLTDDRAIEADLTIDASGRQSRLTDWIEAMGFPRPPQQLVHCDIVYSTAVVRPKNWDAFPKS